ncbi:MAG TPA: CoA pyrophosphatase [Acidimicrobiales bacterium]|nr:CoA pyrophosphatase [Acidimicrobiales bacterium]
MEGTPTGTPDVELGAGPDAPIAPVPREGGRQVIPRPPSARAGSAAPWAELSPGRRHGITVDRVRRAFWDIGSAPADARRLAPDGFRVLQSPAAVLAPLFDEDGEARVILTRRAAHLRAHRGEVSFPGGRLDEGETPEAGALREAAEEIGLDPDPVETIGRLTPVTTFASGSTITPVVGLLPGRPALVASPHEVEHVFDVSLTELADPQVFREEWWTVPGRGPTPLTDGAANEGRQPFPVWFFELPDDTVWGATARMLVDLLRLVLEV